MIQDRSIACEIRNKIRKLGFLGMIMRTHEQACVRIIKPAFMRTQPRLCARGIQPRNPSNTETKVELQNDKSNILTCF